MHQWNIIYQGPIGAGMFRPLHYTTTINIHQPTLMIEVMRCARSRLGLTTRQPCIAPLSLLPVASPHRTQSSHMHAPRLRTTIKLVRVPETSNFKVGSFFCICILLLCLASVRSYTPYVCWLLWVHGLRMRQIEYVLSNSVLGSSFLEGNPQTVE